MSLPLAWATKNDGMRGRFLWTRWRETAGSDCGWLPCLPFWQDESQQRVLLGSGVAPLNGRKRGTVGAIIRRKYSAYVASVVVQSRVTVPSSSEPHRNSYQSFLFLILVLKLLKIKREAELGSFLRVKQAL
jgi:hypothetical protein